MPFILQKWNTTVVNKIPFKIKKSVALMFLPQNILAKGDQEKQNPSLSLIVYLNFMIRLKLTNDKFSYFFCFKQFSPLFLLIMK